MDTILSVSKLVTPKKLISDAVIAWDKTGKITFAGREDQADHIKGKRLDFKGYTASPGLIDIHVHGGYGIAFGEGNLEEDLENYSRWVAQWGVTGFLLTISGPNPSFLQNVIQAYVPLLNKDFPGAQPLGFHLEGPFLNTKKRGAFDPAWLRLPSNKEMDSYLSIGKPWIKQVSLAPELPGANELAEFLQKNEITVALAHSSADFDTAALALKNSFTHVTHTFNAQSSFHHRQPGVVGAILTSKKVTAELIADGFHVHPAAIRILFNCLGSERIVLITDAMPGADLPDGIYNLLGWQITVNDGKALLPDGTIAGSTITLDKCVRNMINYVGCSLPDAIHMASINPATTIRMDEQIGNLSTGKHADIVIFDDKLNVIVVFRKGKQIFKRNSDGK